METSEVITTLETLFTSLLGDIPPELSSMAYIFYMLVLLFVLACFFGLLQKLFEVARWRK